MKRLHALILIILLCCVSYIIYGNEIFTIETRYASSGETLYRVHNDTDSYIWCSVTGAHYSNSFEIEPLEASYWYLMPDAIKVRCK